MAYNSMDLAAFKDVWVFCEQREGKLMPTDFELISEGRKLADELGVKLCGLLLGDNVEGLCKELAGYGADKIVLCESPLLKYYTTDAYAKVICDAIEELQARGIPYRRKHHRPRPWPPLRGKAAHRSLRGLHASGR